MDRYVRRFNEPDELIELDTVRSAQIHRGGMTVSYDIQQPGWRWATHIRPLVGGEWCQVRHVGVVLSGRLAYLLADGTEFEAGPMTLMDVPAGHDAWVVGDEPVTTIGWAGVRGWLAPLETLSQRVLATVLFADIVDSTAAAVRLGPRAWSDVIGDFEARVRDVLQRYRGRLVKTTGDGVLATFDGAARALRAAIAIRDSARDLDLELRMSVHTGEIELADDDIHGVTVHEASRILALAAPGEILVSEVTTALAGNAEVRLDDRGEHELRGMPGARRLFAVAPDANASS